MELAYYALIDMNFDMNNNLDPIPNSPPYGHHHHHLTLHDLHLVPSSPFILLVLLVRVLSQPREELRCALDGLTFPFLLGWVVAVVPRLEGLVGDDVVIVELFKEVVQ